MLLAALRRFGALLVASAAVTAAASVLLGLLLGASASRAIALGFYIVGSVLLLAGFFVGNRGPVRTKTESGALPFFGARQVRWATPEEREEAINYSALLVSLGFVLIALGVVSDTRFELY